MKTKLNVLSIDFDYFQNVDYDTLAYYPDGNDLGTEFSKYIWAIHYAHPTEGKEILKVEVDKEKLERIQRIISDSYSIDTKVMICNSHKHAYDFIKDIYAECDDYDGVAIYNVDMHHDLVNNNPKVDCGNWVSHILEDIPNSTITWIANPVSKEAYGMDESKFEMVSEDLGDLEYIEFNVIFLCRSDMWTPPHLDPYFKELAEYIINEEGFEKILLEKGILDVRDCTKEILEHKKIQSDLMKLNKGFN